MIENIACGGCGDTKAKLNYRRRCETCVKNDLVSKGVVITESGKWAKDCVTGDLLPLDKLREIGWSKGKFYWIDVDKSILDIPKHHLPVPAIDTNPVMEETK